MVSHNAVRLPASVVVVLLVSLLFLCYSVPAVDAQPATVEALLYNVTAFYGDNVTATPPAFQQALYNATVAIFGGTSMNGVPGVPFGSASSGDLTIRRFTYAQAKPVGALCLDGSPYAYYIRRAPASSLNPTKWIVYLQGGSLCVDPTSCALRATTILGSSNSYLQYFTDTTNVLSTSPTQNPTFFDWNLVGMPYCSGDVWGGSATSNTSNPAYPFYFAGTNITAAVIADLIATQGLANATDLVLSGTSAGGIGVFVQVDRFAAALPKARVVGYPQAGFFTVGATYPEWLLLGNASATSTLARPYYDTSLFAVLTPMFTVYQFSPPPACAAYFASIGQPGNVTLCANMPTLYQFVKSPMFILENRFDTFQTANLNVLLFVPALTTVNYLIYYGSQMVSSIATSVAAKGNTDGYFVPSCLDHPTYPEPVTGVSNAAINGVQPAVAFQNWYNALKAGTLNAVTARSFQTYDAANYLPLAQCSITSAFSLPAASVSGDPQFVGLRGQSFQVHGLDGAVYNLITDASLQLNARFAFLDGPRPCPVMPSTGKRSSACWSHPGSYLSELGLQTIGGSKLLLVSGSAASGFASILLDGRPLTAGASAKLEFGSTGLTGSVSVDNSHELTLKAGHFHLVIENNDGFVNLRQVSVASSAWSKLASHGLLGQTWQNKRYSGRVKEIEGDVEDYVVSEDHVYGVGFVFNRYES